MTEQPRGSGKRQLVLMLVIASISLAGATGLYFSARSGSLWGTTNKGTFVSPPLSLADIEILDADGVRMTAGDTWWLWVVQPGECAEACETAMHQLRQLHILLHREAPRVRRALVSPAPGDTSVLREDYPDLEFLEGAVDLLIPGIYIVDPLGNLVLRYDLQDAGKPVLDDLKRLLKVSQIG